MSDAQAHALVAGLTLLKENHGKDRRQTEQAQGEHKHGDEHFDEREAATPAHDDDDPGNPALGLTPSCRDPGRYRHRPASCQHPVSSDRIRHARPAPYR